MLVVGIILLEDTNSLSLFELDYEELCNTKYFGVDSNTLLGRQKAA
jgi:hypothetical protein